MILAPVGAGRNTRNAVADMTDSEEQTIVSTAQEEAQSSMKVVGWIMVTLVFIVLPIIFGLLQSHFSK